MLRRVQQKAGRMKRQWLRSRTLSALDSSTGTPDRILADAYRATIENQLSSQERELLGSIEALRQKLLDSDRMISYHDFGAGVPGDDLTPEEMARGTTRTISAHDVIKRGNLSERYRMLLFHLAKRLQPSTCLELGTSLGFSACYQAAALKLAGRGHLITLEGCENTASVARENLSQLGLEKFVTIVVGRFQDTLPDVLAQNAPIDLAFVDGHHDGDATVGYFRQIVSASSPEAVLIFDDIKWYESMKIAWRSMASDPATGMAVDCDVVGAIRLGERPPGRSLLHLPQ